MTRAERMGSAVFGAGMVAFGALSLARLDLLPDVEPVPAWVPGRVLWACLSGVVLVSGGALLVIGRRIQPAAMALATLLSVWVALLHLPRLVAQPTNGGAWVVACEALALCAAAWTIVAAASTNARRRLVTQLAARLAFGATFLLFGASHFLYRGYVESVIPGWIPAHGFWAVATGLAHLAAGVSLLTGVWSRLATTLLAVMFGTWVAILHLPRVLANPGQPNEWTSLIVALSMCGAAWLVAGTLPGRVRRTADVRATARAPLASV